MTNLIDALENLLGLGDNWDGYGASPMSEQTYALAVDTSYALHRLGIKVEYPQLSVDGKEVEFIIYDEGADKCLSLYVNEEGEHSLLFGVRDSYYRVPIELMDITEE